MTGRLYIATALILYAATFVAMIWILQLWFDQDEVPPPSTMKFAMYSAA